MNTEQQQEVLNLIDQAKKVTSAMLNDDVPGDRDRFLAVVQNLIDTIDEWGFGTDSLLKSWNTFVSHFNAFVVEDGDLSLESVLLNLEKFENEFKEFNVES